MNAQQSAQRLPSFQSRARLYRRSGGDRRPDATAALAAGGVGGVACWVVASAAANASSRGAIANPFTGGEEWRCACTAVAGCLRTSVVVPDELRLGESIAARASVTRTTVTLW